VGDSCAPRQDRLLGPARACRADLSELTAVVLH
jgi:hypothetical protein